jgi:prevent-host-death family protein
MATPHQQEVRMVAQPDIISVTDLREQTRRIVDEAHFRGRTYIVERAGEPMVVIMGVDEYDRMAAAYLRDYTPVPPGPKGPS